MLIIPNFNPSRLTRFTILTEMRTTLVKSEYLASSFDMGANAGFEVLPNKQSPIGSGKYIWHRDGDHHERVMTMAVWASICPTEIRDVSTKKVIEIPNNSIVVFRNDLYQHRYPLAAYRTTGGRWFARVWHLKKI